MAWLEKEGLTLGAPTWEVYVNDPDSTPEEELRTEIYVSLA
jgi:effector-binding domain-containing protein